MATNSTRSPARTKANSVSDSTSKCSAVIGKPARRSRRMRRNPHWESGKGLPAIFEIRRLIQRLAACRNQGIRTESDMRLPTIKAADVCSAHRKKMGASAGECWPSPSKVSTHLNPRWRACCHPAWRAAPLPSVAGKHRTSAPVASATLRVPSLEPSSTISTAETWPRSSAATSPIAAASFKHGTTAMHSDRQSTFQD